MTSLLDDIQRGALDDAVSLTSLLRKCHLLAARLANEPLRIWVTHELEGYPETADVPAYRQPLRGRLVGTIANPVRWYSDVALPEGSLPADVRDSWLTMDMRATVAELEQLGAAPTNPRRPIPPELWSFMDDALGGGYQVLQANVEYSRVAIRAVLDAIRTKALLFAIEIEKLDPSAGENTAAKRIPAETVSQVLHATIYADSVNVGQAAGAVQQVAVASFVPGDFAALARELALAGVTSREVDELRDSLEGDGPSGGEPGPRTREWLGRVALRLVRVSGDLAGQTGASVVAMAVARYLGLTG